MTQADHDALSVLPVRVVAAVIQRGNEVLVCLRPLHKRHGGLWEFPGGKCEPDESDAEAIQRELLEELGVVGSASGAALYSVMDPGSRFEIVFVPATIMGTPSCREHLELRWATIGELRQLPLAPSDRRFLASFEEGGSCWVSGGPQSGSTRREWT